MNNYYQNTQYGYGYTAPRPQARNTQPLTQEQILKLRTDSKGFDMKIDQEDLWRAACTHKEKNGASTLIQNADGSYTCTICQETFNMVDLDRATVEEKVKELKDILQTAKTIYVDAPEKLIEQYFQLLALLGKLPELWDRSIKNFSMYDSNMVGGVNQMGAGYGGGFNALQNMLTNPSYGGYPMGGQQYMAYPQPMTQAPQYYGGGYYQMPTQPMAQAPMMDPNANPMAYGAPQQMPMAPAVGTIPNAPQPQAAPAQAPVPAPAQPQQAEVQQTQVFNV